MKTYEGYKLVHANDEQGTHRGTIWWDGQHTRASTDELLRRIKRTVIPFSSDPNKGMPKFSDGLSFFKMLPMAYRTGYVHLEKVTVDEKGEEV